MTKQDKKIIAIWAEAETGVIGKEMTMPWHLPAELAHFKETTMGQVILMGRVTFDGMKRRLLPGRQTLILTTDQDFQVDGVLSFTSVDAVLDWFQEQDKDLYIAGGASIYKAFEPYYDKVIKTTVHAEIDGDTYFPELDLTRFDVIGEKSIFRDDKNKYDFTIMTLERRGTK